MPDTNTPSLAASVQQVVDAVADLCSVADADAQARALLALFDGLPFERLLSRYKLDVGLPAARDEYLRGDVPRSLYAYTAADLARPIFDVVHGPTDDRCRDWIGLDDAPSDPNDPANWYDVSVDLVGGGTLHDYLGPYASAGDKLRHAEERARALGWLVPFEPATAEQRAQIAVARAAMQIELGIASWFASTRVPVEAVRDPFGELSISLADAAGKRKTSAVLFDEVIVALPKITDERSRGRIMRALGIRGILPDPWNGLGPAEADPFDDVLACLERNPYTADDGEQG